METIVLVAIKASTIIIMRNWQTHMHKLYINLSTPGIYDILMYSWRYTYANLDWDVVIVGVHIIPVHYAIWLPW